MTGPGRRQAARAVATGLGAWNLLLLTRPDAVPSALSVPPPGPPRWVVRLLGARGLLQQAAVVIAPTRRLVLGGGGVDGLHAASMVLAAAVSPRYRRAAGLSAAAATASALLAVATAPAPDRTVVTVASTSCSGTLFASWSAESIDGAPPG